MKKTIQVIIVDDEPKIRRGISRMIKELGEDWQVLGDFSNGLNALDYIKTTSERIDLLITDVKMPMMDGLQLIQEAKRYKDLVPLVISGYDDFVYVRTALREGVIDYILKPIDRPNFKFHLFEIRNKIQSKRYAAEVNILKRNFMEDYDHAAKDEVYNEFKEGTFRLCCVILDEPPQKMKSYDETDWNLLYYSIHNIVEEWIHRDQNQIEGWSWQENNKGHTWVLLRNMEEVNILLENIRHSISRYLSMTVTISVGPEFDDLFVLSQMRNEVLSLLYLRLIYGGNRVYARENMLVASTQEVSSKLHQIGDRLRIIMLQEEVTASYKLLNEFLDEVSLFKEPEAIEQAVQYCILHMMSVLSESDHKKAKIWMLEELNDIHSHLSSFPRLRSRLLDIFQKTTDYIRNKRKNVERTPVDQGKEWINKHLKETITIQRVAEQIPMNATYFCEIFKLQTSETVHDYITRKRMKAAAELLVKTEDRIQDVANQVGYKDVKYFSRQFRKYFGILPSKYREMNL
jgi:two-component system response regulator YesN